MYELTTGMNNAVKHMAVANKACFDTVSASFSRYVKLLLPGKEGRLECTGRTLEEGVKMVVGIRGTASDGKSKQESADEEGMDIDDAGARRGRSSTARRRTRPS